MEETIFRKKVATAVVQPRKDHYYMVDVNTGDVFETELKHPEYIKYKKEKLAKRLAKNKVKEEAKMKRVMERKAKKNTLIEAKLKVIEERKLALEKKESKLRQLQQ